MKKLFLALLIFLSVQNTFGAWSVVNTGINDKLNSIWYWPLFNGVIAGNQGVYYTTTGTSSWTRFNITGNTVDSILYNNCQFLKIASSYSLQTYIVGNDTVNNKAVIFYFNLNNLSYSFKYIGATGSKLNNIIENNFSLWAIGDAGLFIESSGLNSYSVIPTGTFQDLYSIGQTGANLYVGGDKVFLNGTYSGSVLSFASYAHPTRKFKGLSTNGIGTGKTFSVGPCFYNTSNFGASAVEYYNYDSPPLNAADCYYVSSILVVGTDHGIYGLAAPNQLEYQPSSSNYSIHDIWFDVNNTGYATSDNGVLLTTNNYGFPSKPYATLSLTGWCAATNVVLGGSPGSGSNCKWLVNGTQIATTCYPTYNFPTAGTYTVTYIVWNSGGLYDTAQQIVNIVNVPNINLPYSIVDSIICHQGSIAVIFNNTQNNYSYTLKKFGSSFSYGTINGNGSSAILNSNVLDSTGKYYVQVGSTLASCKKNFTDTIHVLAEKTKAGLHSTLINARLNEAVSFMENCTDAQNFKWTFSNNASPASSLVSNPVVSFALLGATTVKLISWSNNGCYDSTQVAGPQITNEPGTEDSCWVSYFDGIDPAWAGSPPPPTNDLKVMKDGSMLLCGTYNNHIFPSRYGSGYGRTNGDAGSFIGNYSKNGTLRWVVKSKVSAPAGGTGFFGTFNKMDTDASGNIYAVGTTGNSTWFYTNEGDSTNLNAQWATPYSSQLVKLDSLGKLLWVTNTLYSIANKIHVAKDKSVIITGIFDSTVVYNRNGYDTTVLSAPNNYDPNYLYNSFIMKLDSNGKVKWTSFIYDYYVNGAGINDISSDINGNIYLTGYTENASYFYSSNGTQGAQFLPPSSYSSGGYLVKYDTSGIFSFIATATSGINNPNYGIEFNKICTDDQGNSYITGSNEAWNNGGNFVFTDSAGQITNKITGGFILLKINSSGELRWMSTSSGDNGMGTALKLKSTQLIVGGRDGVFHTAASWSDTLFYLNLYSANSGFYVPFVIDQGDFFIANYDTAGTAYWLDVSGINTYNARLWCNTVDVSASGSVYFCGSMGDNSLQANCSIFNNAIPMNGEDGFFGGKLCSQQFHTTGISSFQKRNDLSVLPNPAQSYIRVNSVDKIGILSVYNSFGDLVLKTESKKETELIDISNLSPGMYIIFMKEGSVKFIKE